MYQLIWLGFVHITLIIITDVCISKYGGISSSTQCVFCPVLQYIQLMTNQNQPSRIECRSLFSTMKDMVELYQKMINQTYLPGSKTMQCLEQIPTIPSKIFSGDVL